MYVVHIYAEVDNAILKKAERMIGYVLECEGKERTVEGFCRIDATYHAATLSALCLALSRINQSCEVHIHTQNTYIANVFKNSLPGWAANDFQGKAGKLVRNDELWRKLWMYCQKHMIVMEPGLHPYLHWMEDEFLRRRIKGAL